MKENCDAFIMFKYIIRLLYIFYFLQKYNITHKLKIKVQKKWRINEIFSRHLKDKDNEGKGKHAKGWIKNMTFYVICRYLFIKLVIGK